MDKKGAKHGVHLQKRRMRRTQAIGPRPAFSYGFDIGTMTSGTIFEDADDGADAGGGGGAAKNDDGSAEAAAPHTRQLQHQHPHVGLRVRRAILSGRRASPSTPFPSWKLYENPFYDGIAAAAAAAAAKHRGLYLGQSGGGAASGVVISARTLAATLWELQELPSLSASARASPQPLPIMSSHVRRPSPLQIRHGRDGSPLRALGHDYSYADSPSPSKFIQPSSKLLDSSRRNANSSRQAAAMRSHVHRLQEKDTKLSPCTLSPANGSSPLMQPQKQAIFPNDFSDTEMQLLPEPEYPTTSSDLLKVLNRIRDLEEQYSSSTSMIATLKMELNHSRSRVQELEMALKASRRELDSVVKKFAQERMHLQAEEKDKIRAAVSSLKEQIEDERKGRRRMDIVNRKIARELAECNMALTKSLRDLDKERKARELMEDVCDELAREIGEDKAEVEELRRESAKVREEVEEERKMLQMAEVWREERVQMKLGEARLELEERNDALDHLRAQLEAFLKSRQLSTEKGESQQNQADVEEAEKLKDAVTTLQLHEPRVLSGKGDVNDALSEDLHTIDLTRDRSAGNYMHEPVWDEKTRDASNDKKAEVHSHTAGGSMDWEDGDYIDDVLDDGIAREWIYTESGVIERRNGVEWDGNRRRAQQQRKEEEHEEKEDEAEDHEREGDDDYEEESQWESASEENEKAAEKGSTTTKDGAGPDDPTEALEGTPSKSWGESPRKLQEVERPNSSPVDSRKDSTSEV